MSDQQNLPARVEEQHLNVVATFNPLEDTTSGNFYTTLQRDTPDGRKKLLAALQGSSKKGEEYLNKEFILSDIVVHQVQILDKQTGELADAVRCVLVSPDGDTVAFVSLGVFQSLKNIARIYGPPPYAKGLRLLLKQVTTRKANRLYQLEVIE